MAPLAIAAIACGTLALLLKVLTTSGFKRGAEFGSNGEYQPPIAQRWFSPKTVARVDWLVLPLLLTAFVLIFASQLSDWPSRGPCDEVSPESSQASDQSGGLC